MTATAAAARGRANRNRGNRLCACGCGATCKPGNRYLNGHNKRIRRPDKKCECGCGAVVPHRSRFVQGHHSLIRDVAARFASWVSDPDDNGCLKWLGSKDQCGYGMFQVDGHSERAHRYSYSMIEGPIPEGLTLDHLCRNRACVNPAHLEPVTNRVNVLRGISPVALNARKTRCHRGHPFTAENTVRTSQGNRRCRECKNIEARLYRANRRAS